MDYCAVCDEQAIYKCMPCKLILCKNHKAEHEAKQGSHILLFSVMRFTPDQQARFVENLSRNILTADEFIARILNETTSRITIVNKMCREALRFVEEKKKLYAGLLVNVQDRLYAFQDEDIEAELNTVVEINSSVSIFEEIESFYKLDCLKESMHSNIVDELSLLGECNTQNIELNSQSARTIASDNRLQELTGVIPDYSNSSSLAAEKRLGPYKYRSKPLDTTVSVIRRNAILVGNLVIYTGEWNSNLQRHGRGVQIWKSGAKYEGNWRDDKANGDGRFIYGNGDVYEGEWVDDEFHGHGIYLRADGNKYEGSWVNSKQHGKGKETFPDGGTYEGEYLNGLKGGRGILTSSDGSLYEGEFRADTMNGIGKYTWSDGRKYEGMWRNNLMHGKGEFRWVDGKVYIGEYVDDKKEGFGLLKCPNGKWYEGEWKNEKQNGAGKCSLGPNNMWEGKWIDGKMSVGKLLNQH